ncbi:MAG TPA: 2TM domain-containing protein [Synechococcales cyanobacterium M55_K2018_004]|nr:2TM domain-containing protein [Synechococcales cyanobacterium M55_K2018_004]
MSEFQGSEVYTPEEVQQILNLAIARQMASDQLSRAQLLEIANEMGITAAELTIAERDWRLQDNLERERQEFDRSRQNQFQQRCTRYMIVNGFLAAIALLISGGSSLLWTPFILATWGMFLALDAWNVYGLRGDRYEAQFQGWRRKRQLKRSVNNLLNRFLGA